jgi:predicted DsbA family dithiol-disulfide isomerase
MQSINIGQQQQQCFPLLEIQSDLMPECPECKKNFGTEESMQQHMKDKHATKKEESTAEKIKEQGKVESKPEAKQEGKKSNIKWIGLAVLVIIIIAAAFLMLSKPSYTIQRDRMNFFGPADAKVTITEYSDFQCPACGLAFATFDQLKDRYNSTRIVFSHFPLPQHTYAEKAAEAAECAGDQGRFWEYHDTLFSHQDALQADALKSYAKQLGLNATLFDACLDSGVMASRVSSDKNAALSRGVQSTPTFFVNDVKIEGSQSLSYFDRVVGIELSK